MAQLLLGKEVLKHMHIDLTARVEALKTEGYTPTLAILRVGEHPDDMSYERTAVKRAETLGVAVQKITLPETISQQELQVHIQAINRNPEIHGCLMFRPLPVHIAEQKMCNELILEKDIDGISFRSLAQVFAGTNQGYPPCTAEACLTMLDHYHIPIAGTHVVVIGRSLVVGKPLSMMMLNRHASVTICHSRTKNLAELCKTADIIICAAGRAKMIDDSFVSPGQILLDVGINFDEDGKLVGDIDFDRVEPIVEAITPVPGGVGSVTTSLLMQHVISACELISAR